MLRKKISQRLTHGHENDWIGKLNDVESNCNCGVLGCSAECLNELNGFLHSVGKCFNPLLLDFLEKLITNEKDTNISSQESIAEDVGDLGQQGLA